MTTPVPTVEPLRIALGLAQPGLRAAGAALWQGPGLRRRYIGYLRTMHGVIRASVPLMRLAARRCAERGHRDPLAAPLGAYLRGHIAEEHGHDDWLVDDLAGLGHDPRPVLAGAPSAAVARLVGPQYYWIEHFHPVALLGYIAVLESNAPAPGVADWIRAATGFPETALRTVRAHAELDGAHSADVFRLLDSLPLTASQAEAVRLSGLSTIDGLLDVYARISATEGDQL